MVFVWISIRRWCMERNNEKREKGEGKVEKAVWQYAKPRLPRTPFTTAPKTPATATLTQKKTKGIHTQDKTEDNEKGG